MRVCFLAGTLGRGGAERQLVFMLRALVDNGLKPHVLCLTKGESFEDDIRQIGLDVSWIGESPFRLNRLWRIACSARSLKANIIQSAHFYTNVYAGLAGLASGVPSIGAIRNDLLSELEANPFFGRWHLNLPRHLIANSRAGLNGATSRGIPGGKIDLVQNVVETNLDYQPKSRHLRGGLNILFVGRLVDAKRPIWFLDLANRLLRDMPKAQLHFSMLGDGPLRRELETKATQYGMSPDNITFLGERIDVASVYRQADLLVLTSKHEGTPNVILEAMSHSVPVIATRVGGVGDILSDNSGITVDPNDFEGLIAASKKILLQPNLRHEMGRAGREYVISQHSIDQLGPKLIRIYSNLINGRK